MFNPHIHQQQQQQQQFHQHLRQLQQLFQQQPPPPPPPPPPPGHHVTHHHHQAQRTIPVAPQTAPPPRMVNLCQATQTTIIAPNPMLQGALLMQQMQGNMRGFGMGGQQFRQFFATGSRSSLLGPVPMGMAIKSPMMGFPAARPYHPHARYYSNSSTASSSFTSSADAATRQPDRKRDSEQMSTGNTCDQPAAISTSEATVIGTDGAVGGVDETTQPSEDQLDEPAVKKPRTDGSEEAKDQSIVKTVTIIAAEGGLSPECCSNTEDSQPEDCLLLEEGGSTGGSDAVEGLEESGAAESEDDQLDGLLLEEMPQGKEASLASPGDQEEEEDGAAEGVNKFYCYLCSITCHNQQNFRTHMNSVSHQQRMMEIQHMSNACLVSLLPRVHESLQEASKDGEKKTDVKHWCATCHTHFTSSIKEHRGTEEHKLASRAAVSSCTVCKKHFRTSQIFVEHLQSQEHRQKVEKLQQQEGCEALGKLTAMDTEGFSVEEVEDSDVEEGEERHEDWSSLKEVTLKDMTSDEQYDSGTVYGSSFFVPVAGFICRLCNKFYHFESSALHTHCKSIKHFDNLKKYREAHSQKTVAVESRESLSPGDRLRPVTETTTDCSGECSPCEDTDSVMNLNSMQPVISLCRVSTQTETLQQKEPADPDPTNFSDTSNTDQELISHSKEKQTSEVLPSPAEPPAGSTEEADSQPAAPVEETNEEEEPPPAVPGTKKAKSTPKRRSGRAANKR